MNNILICILFLLVLVLSKKVEKYITYKIPVPLSCHREKKYNQKIYNYDNEMLLPPIYVPEIIGNKSIRKKYRFYHDTILNKDMINIINNIPKKKINTNYIEISQPKFYDYYSNNRGTKISFDFIHNLINPSSKIILNYIRKFLKISYKNYNCNNKKDCHPIIINTSLIKLEKSKNSYRITFSLEIQLVNKSFSYILVTKTEIINNKHYINNIKLLGNRFQDKIELLPGYENNIQHVRIYNNSLQTPYNTQKTYYRDSNENNKLIINKMDIKKILKTRENKSNYSCIGKESFNKIDCESDSNELSISSKKGIWDKKCSYHIECPFYQSNKNYPNRRGKCINGQCEFPIGIKKLSFRKYDKKSKPLCYNCIDGYNCCEEQLNKKKYPKLVTPDYIFNNDFQTRQKNIKILSKKGLNII